MSMVNKEGFTPPYREGDGETPTITKEIQRRLGEFGIKGYVNLPRKQKKSAKKLAQGKRLSQRELARLDALRRQQREN